jgi:hypothetical protein
LRILLSFAKVVQIERNTKLIQLIFKSEMQPARLCRFVPLGQRTLNSKLK